MTNKNVAICWVNNMLLNKYDKICGRNFYGIDNYLVSYNKPICEYKKMIFNCSTKYYGEATKRHQYYLNLALMDLDDPRILVKQVDQIEGTINV